MSRSSCITPSERLCIIAQQGNTTLASPPQLFCKKKKKGGTFVWTDCFVIQRTETAHTRTYKHTQLRVNRSDKGMFVFISHAYWSFWDQGAQASEAAWWVQGPAWWVQGPAPAVILTDWLKNVLGYHWLFDSFSELSDLQQTCWQKHAVVLRYVESELVTVPTYLFTLLRYLPTNLLSYLYLPTILPTYLPIDAASWLGVVWLRWTATQWHHPQVQAVQ